MSDIHILEADQYGNTLRTVMHFPVPTGDNAAGVAWQAIQSVLWGDAPSEVPTIDPAEQAQLDAGELYEHGYSLHSNPAEGASEKRTRLDEAFESEKTRVLVDLAARLRYWGLGWDVP